MNDVASKEVNGISPIRKIMGIIFFLIAIGWIWQECGGKADNKPVSTEYNCPHCSGMGKRLNNVSGKYGECYSCQGDGKVSQEQYDRLSK
jgi:hypothetical protein